MRESYAVGSAVCGKISGRGRSDISTPGSNMTGSSALAAAECAGSPSGGANSTTAQTKPGAEAEKRKVT